MYFCKKYETIKKKLDVHWPPTTSFSHAKLEIRICCRPQANALQSSRLPVMLIHCLLPLCWISSVGHGHARSPGRGHAAAPAARLCLQSADVPDDKWVMLAGDGRCSASSADQSVSAAISHHNHQPSISFLCSSCVNLCIHSLHKSWTGLK